MIKARPDDVPPARPAAVPKKSKPAAGVSSDVVSALRFVQELPGWMGGPLEVERAKRGLRSRAETIRVLLGEALK